MGLGNDTSPAQQKRARNILTPDPNFNLQRPSKEPRTDTAEPSRKGTIRAKARKLVAMPSITNMSAHFKSSGADDAPKRDISMPTKFAQALGQPKKRENKQVNTLRTKAEEAERLQAELSKIHTSFMHTSKGHYGHGHVIKVGPEDNPIMENAKAFPPYLRKYIFGLDEEEKKAQSKSQSKAQSKPKKTSGMRQKNVEANAVCDAQVKELCAC